MNRVAVNSGLLTISNPPPAVERDSFKAKVIAELRRCGARLPDTAVDSEVLAALGVALEPARRVWEGR